MRENIFVKIYNLFRYKIPYFLKNVWSFRKALWAFRWYDYHYTLKIMRTSLEVMSDNIEKKGMEIDSSRLKKVTKMRRAIEIINNMDGIHHLEVAEKELGSIIHKDWEFVPEGNDLYSINDKLNEKEIAHNRKVYKRADELENKEWEELWKIFQGQKHEKFIKTKGIDWDDWFDGTGINTWWD